jgi:hypothetical protein
VVVAVVAAVLAHGWLVLLFGQLTSSSSSSRI